MGYIAVDHLKLGMVLSEDVRDINTRLLLSKGQKIDPKHIRILKIWGVGEVNVVGAAETGSGPLPSTDPEKERQVKNQVGRLFKHLDLNHPIVNEICQAALLHRLRGESAPAPDLEYPPIQVQEELRRPEGIRQQIFQIDIQLPEAPVIINELNEVIADPLATSNDVARVVNTSPSLAAQLLRIVNSAYYGFSSKIDRISRAVTIIGTKEISGLALGISVMQAFNDIPEQIIEMQAFIRHSLACGTIARILAARGNMAQTEQLFVAGLLHDIGKLVFFKYYPEHAKACLQLAASTATSLFDAEKNVIGLHHAHMGRFLLEKWKLPQDLTDIVVCHHAPSKAAEPVKAGIVQLADLMTHGLGIGRSGEFSVPGFDAGTAKAIGLGPYTIQTVLRQVVHQLGPMEAIFSG
jgi:putative nucleotidyltransferase with HDIG domain